MNDRIDLNTADQATLDGIEDLRGHGPEIIRYRDERGGFTDLRQLDEVPGLTGKVTDEARQRLKL